MTTCKAACASGQTRLAPFVSMLMHCCGGKSTGQVLFAFDAYYSGIFLTLGVVGARRERGPTPGESKDVLSIKPHLEACVCTIAEACALCKNAHASAFEE